MPGPISLDHAYTLLREGIPAPRPPVLVVGSGILQQCRFGPFADWNTLMHEVACELGLPFDPAIASAHPTLYWESMMAQAAREGHLTNPTTAKLSAGPLMQGGGTPPSPPKDASASDHERKAQIHVARLVRNAARRMRTSPLRKLINAPYLQSIVTLNFTAEPFVTRGESRLAIAPIPHLPVQGRVIWCPHGNERHPRTIRLGARGYAQTLSKLERLRRQHRLKIRLDEGTAASSATTPPSFMNHILESPLIFAGCGLQSAEWTLWWLLATKARNEARQPACPSIYIAGRQVARLHARALDAMNCTVLQVDEHDAVWEAVDRLTKA